MRGGHRNFMVAPVWARYIRGMNQKMALFMALFLLGVIGCAPGSGDPGRVEVEQVTGPAEFYPHQTGAIWYYLPSGERLDATRVARRVEGPTMIGGRRLVASREVGRGRDNSEFRDYRADGVFVVRRTRPGALIEFDPPLQEWPAEGELRVGSSWAGETTAELTFTEARPENRRQTLKVRYACEVVDRRTVSVVAGSFAVFVTNCERESINDDGETVETLRQEIWFAPFIGEIRTDTGDILVDTNFDLAAARARAGER